MSDDTLSKGSQLVATPPSVHCSACVVIPVRDEGDTIEATLAALVQQVNLDGHPMNPDSYEIIILANNCSDDTADVARHFAARNPQVALHVVEVTLPRPEAHVGSARRLVMDLACHRLLSSGRPDGIIATTDGDTLVAPTWLAATRAEIHAGADAVGGRISISPAELRSFGAQRLRHHLNDVGYRSLATELESYLDPEVHDPWPRHFQHFGASMAVTAEMYLRVGGLPVRPWLEDVAFYHLLFRADARIRHSPLVRVTTSARDHGRTGFGFAVQLAQWEQMQHEDLPLFVESADAIEARTRARKALRSAWMSRDNVRLDVLAHHLLIDVAWLRETLAAPTTFGALHQFVEAEQQRNGLWRNQWPMVDIRQARWDLRCRLDVLRRSRRQLTHFKEIQPVALAPAIVEMR